MYEGIWNLNIREGEGKLVREDGVEFTGTFKANKPNGQVEIKYPNGNVYTGEVIDGVPNGKGVEEVVENKERYEGDFKNGIR